MKKIITALLFTLLVVQAVFTTAFAADTGSLTVKLLRADETPVSGRQIKAYRAGDCTIDYDGEPYFTTADSFKGAGVTLTSENTAQKLADYAKNNSLTFQTYTSDANGIAVINNCDTGVYLIVSEDGIFLPFLVSVPIDENGGWNYNVTAEPKVDDPESPTNPEPTKPTEPETITPTGINPGGNVITGGPQGAGAGDGSGSFSSGGKEHIPGVSVTSKSSEGEKAGGEKLPQTGMLQYPVPVLGASGLIIFVIGCFVYGTDRKKEKK